MRASSALRRVRTFGTSAILVWALTKNAEPYFDGDGADDGDDRRVRTEALPVELHHVVTREPRHGFTCALHREAVGVAREDEPGQGPRGDSSRVLLGALDGRLDLADLPRDLARR